MSSQPFLTTSVESVIADFTSDKHPARIRGFSKLNSLLKSNFDSIKAAHDDSFDRLFKSADTAIEKVALKWYISERGPITQKNSIQTSLDLLVRNPNIFKGNFFLR
jgi:hypothetical protein